MKNLLLGIIAINLTFILFYLALRSVEPVHAAQSSDFVWTEDLPYDVQQTTVDIPSGVIQPHGNEGVVTTDPQGSRPSSALKHKPGVNEFGNKIDTKVEKRRRNPQTKNN